MNKSTAESIEAANRSFKSLISGLSSRSLALFAMVVLGGLLGTYFLAASHAATTASSIELESGTTASPATVQSDSSASGGKSVKFGAAGTGTCPISTPNVAGGPDGIGGCFPGAGNTGVPTGTTLTAYSGGCTVSSNTTIDAKTINCPGGLNIEAAVTITRSKINGRVIIDTDTNSSWSLVLTDSEVDGGNVSGAGAVTSGNVNILRANLHGAHSGLQCEEHSFHCIMTDSWVHGQYLAGEDHLAGVGNFGSVKACDGPSANGVSSCLTMVHNSILCEPLPNAQDGGCTADLSLLPQFGPMHGALVTNNLFGSNIGIAYCTYGAGPGAGDKGGDHIVYTGNVFQRGSNGKCGNYGPVTAFIYNGTGNIWSNNKWNDGTALNCNAANDCS